MKKTLFPQTTIYIYIYIYIYAVTHQLHYTNGEEFQFGLWSCIPHLLTACQGRRHRQGRWWKSWRKMSTQNAGRRIRITVVCDVTPCSLVKSADFTGYPVTSNFWEEEIIQRMEAAGSLETCFHIKDYNETRPRTDVHTVSGTVATTKSCQQSALGDVREHVEDEGTVFFGGMHYCSRTS
jgi:hypothetical protein